MNFDTVAEELYGAARGDFVALREERAAQARSDGDRELAERLHRLRKPTKAAALINQLVRRRPAELDTLFGLARKLRQAHADLAGDELRALTRERAEFVRRLTNQAAEFEDGELGQSIESEVANTLGAAVADPELGQELRRGRLTSAFETPAEPLFPAGSAPERAEPARSHGRRSGREHATGTREREPAGERRTKKDPRAGGPEPGRAHEEPSHEARVRPDRRRADGNRDDGDREDGGRKDGGREDGSREDEGREDRSREDRSREDRNREDRNRDGEHREEQHREGGRQEDWRDRAERRAQDRSRKEWRREAEVAARRFRNEARKELRAAERAETKARERTEAARRTFEAAEAQLRDATSQ